MIADQRVIDNIKKLKGLGMSDKDIKENLLKMGLSDKDCDQLIKQAMSNEAVVTTDNTEKKDLEPDTIKDISLEDKKEAEEKETKEEQPKSNEIPSDFFNSNEQNKTTPKPAVETKVKESTDTPDLAKGLDINKLNELSKKEADSSPSSTNDKDESVKDFFKDFNLSNNYSSSENKIDDAVATGMTTFDTSSDDNTSDIWQSGLATTINNKLNDIDKKQEFMENFIKNKLNQELDKYKRVQETTKQLLIGKLEGLVNEQQKSVNTIITKQLAQIKIEQAKLNKKVEEIKTGKDEVEDLVHSVNEMKHQLVDTSTKAQSNINKVMTTTTVKLNAKMKQINEILTLQSRISQGLVKNTQTAINNEIKKLADFRNMVSKQVNPDKLYNKLNELESFKQQLANRYDSRFEKVKIEFLDKAKIAFKDSINSELKELKDVRDTIVKKTDPEIINKKLDELAAFEKHLLTNIDEKISQSLKIYEGAVTQEFKQKIKKIDEIIEKIGYSEDKINEINNFKDQFIAIIDKNIEKMNSTMKVLEDKLKENK